jgi:hypothetical protein
VLDTGASESLVLSLFLALKGRGNVAQGKRPSAPPWVEVPCELSPLPRMEHPGYGKISSQSGGEGNGEWGLLGANRGTAPQYLQCPETHLWDTMSSVEDGVIAL